MIVMCVVAIVRVLALVTLMVMWAQAGMFIAVGMGLFVAMGMNVSIVAVFMVVMFMTVMFMVMLTMMIVVVGPMFGRLVGLALLRACAFDHAALDAVAMATAARITVARAAAVRAILALFLGFAMCALIRLDQRLAVGNRNLIVVRMDFAEGQKTVAVAAIFDEGGLQRWLYARYLGEIDVSAQLLALGGLEIKLFDAIAADHDDPGLFRVGSIDQHFVGHFGALGGGGRVWRCARVARPGDATVHLIRG
jgi:hypothetical protein